MQVNQPKEGGAEHNAAMHHCQRWSITSSGLGALTQNRCSRGARHRINELFRPCGCCLSGLPLLVETSNGVEDFISCETHAFVHTKGVGPSLLCATAIGHIGNRISGSSINVLADRQCRVHRSLRSYPRLNAERLISPSRLVCNLGGIALLASSDVQRGQNRAGPLCSHFQHGPSIRSCQRHLAARRISVRVRFEEHAKEAHQYGH